MARKMIFIVNPRAGGGKAERAIPLIKKTMEEVDIEYDIIKTKGPKNAIDISEKSIKEGYMTIVAVGGDGTINEVATGIYRCGKGILGIIPRGTGNDLARTLGIPSDINRAMEIIIKGEKKKVDIGFVNSNLFLNIASIGFDAEVVKNAQNIKKRIKLGISYIISIFTSLFMFKAKEINLKIDGISINKKIILVAIGNGKYYGGGLKILPMANVEDGFFHICIVNTMPKIKLLFLFPSIFNGKHIRFKKYVEILKLKDVNITIRNQGYLNLDGEIYDTKKEMYFAIEKKGLSIYADN